MTSQTLITNVLIPYLLPYPLPYPHPYPLPYPHSYPIPYILISDPLILVYKTNAMLAKHY